MPTIREVLLSKGPTVVTVRPDQSMREAVDLLVAKKIGSLLVQEPGGPLLGILTERDVLRLTCGSAGCLSEIPVRDHMTRNLVTIRPEEEVQYALSLMTRMRFRRLPVVDQGRLVGIVSIGDLVKAMVAEKEAEIKALHAYIAGGPVA